MPTIHGWVFLHTLICLQSVFSSDFNFAAEAPLVTLHLVHDCDHETAVPGQLSPGCCQLSAHFRAAKNAVLNRRK